MSLHARRRLSAAALLVAAAVLVAVLLVSAGPAGSGSSAHAAGGPEASGKSGTPLKSPELVVPHFRHEPRAGILVDLDSGRVLWHRNARQVLAIASLAKMMTALLVVEHAGPKEGVLVTAAAEAAPGSRVGVLPLRRRVPLETLLYGLLLPSGNDAAIALAQHVGGSVGGFVALMNAKAQSLGLSCTHFASPDGFDNANRSCAEDLVALARADLAEPRIARVTGTRAAVLPAPIKGGRIWLYNNNPLLRRGFPGVTGLKTGETEAAGLCLVATAERHGVRLVSVLLHSPDLARQSAALLNAGFRAESPAAGGRYG